MARKDKKGQQQDDAPATTKVVTGPVGGARFDSSEPTLEAGKSKVNPTYLSKPWTRQAWVKATPFVLEQRQKLESQGWSPVDGARTELYVLKRNAPQGSYTDDGFMYVRMPKKFIDFHRSGKSHDDEDAATKRKRISKRKENAPSYELNSEHIWKIRIDGESDQSDRDSSVILDVLEPLENLFYLIMCLQPGMAQLWATRKDVIQPGTQTTDIRDDAEAPTARHRAMVAATESYTRVLPPAFWFKRNSEELRKIFGDALDVMAEAAEDPERSVTHDIKDVKEKTWEEKLPPVAPVKGKKKKAAAAANTAPIAAPLVADTVAA